jgi:hypothetical protein
MKNKKEKIQAILKAVAGDRAALNEVSLPVFMVLIQDEDSGLFKDSSTGKSYSKEECEILGRELRAKNELSVLALVRVEQNKPKEQNPDDDDKWNLRNI